MVDGMVIRREVSVLRERCGTWYPGSDISGEMRVKEMDELGMPLCNCCVGTWLLLVASCSELGEDMLGSLSCTGTIILNSL